MPTVPAVLLGLAGYAIMTLSGIGLFRLSAPSPPGASFFLTLASAMAIFALIGTAGIGAVLVFLFGGIARLM